jgi:ribose transport system permease protein
MTETATNPTSPDPASPSPASPEPPASTRAGRLDVPRVLDFVERYALVGMLVLVVVVFSTLPETRSIYFTQANWRILLGNQSVLIVASLATLIPLLTLQYDLSIGNIITLSTVMTATTLSEQHWNPWLGILAGVSIGAAVGLFNGWLSAYVGVNSLIATLGFATVISGSILGYTNGQSIVSGLPESINDFGTGRIGVFPYVFLTALGVAGVLGYILRFLPVGRKMMAVGSNARAARLVGIDVRRMIMLSFVLAGVVAGVGGILQLAQTGAANPSLGGTLTLPALAAVFLGATTIRPGTYNILGTIVAVLFLGALRSGLSLAGMPDWINIVVDGAALVIGVAVSALLSKRRPS